MDASNPHPDLLEAISEAVKSAGGTITHQDHQTVQGTLSAITSKWFLGGRKVTDSVTCRLVPGAHEVHLREVAHESSWGLPPPTLTIEKSTQAGTRVSSSRIDATMGAGGGRLEFGKFRDTVEQATRDAGWAFVYDVP
jgi:hypothetical protein